MEELIGRKILSVGIDEEHDILRFKTDAGPVFYMTENECCNWVYFNDILGIKEILGKVVNSITHHDCKDISHDSSAIDCLDEYMITLNSDTGRCDITYRNSSNGYYGGYCVNVPGDKPWENSNQEPPTAIADFSYRELTEDWTTGG